MGPPENVNSRLSLRGALAMKQSIYPLCRAMDCFASLAMTWMVLRHSQLSSPAHAGDPVRAGFSAQSLASLGYWVPACAGTTSEGVTRTFAISRRDAPE